MSRRLLFAGRETRSGDRRSIGAERLRGLTLSPIKDVELQASRLPGVVSLAQGIPSFDTPEPIKRFVAERMAEGVCARYSVSPGLPQLREAIADALQDDGMRYDPDREILVTVGSIEAIAATLLASIDEGDEVLVVSPTYASYLPAIRLAGGVPRFVPLNEDANFDLDPDAIEEAAGRRTRAILLCNPNNPTGTVFSREQTQRMLRVAAEHDLLVITDEVYKDFVYGEQPIFSAAMEASARERVVRVCSFSKAFGMTGWRVGYLHGPPSASPTFSPCTTRSSPAPGGLGTLRLPHSNRATRSSPNSPPSSAAAATTWSSGSTRCRTYSTTRSPTRRTSSSRASRTRCAGHATRAGWRPSCSSRRASRSCPASPSVPPARRICACAMRGRQPTSTSPSTAWAITSPAARRERW
jgi:aspartate/methionine/tyrosine aminotransferase